MYIRISTGARRHDESNLDDDIQKRINTLNEWYNNQENDAEKLLNSLSMLVGKQK